MVPMFRVACFALLSGVAFSASLREVASSLVGEKGPLLSAEKAFSLCYAETKQPAVPAGGIMYLLSLDENDRSQKLAIRAMSRFPDDPLVLQARLCASVKSGSIDAILLQKLVKKFPEDSIVAMLSLNTRSFADGKEVVSALRKIIGKKPISFLHSEFARAVVAVLRKAGWKEESAIFYALFHIPALYLQELKAVYEMVSKFSSNAVSSENYDQAIMLNSLLAELLKPFVESRQRPFSERIEMAEMLSSVYSALSSCYLQKGSDMMSADALRKANDMKLLSRRLARLRGKSRFFTDPSELPPEDRIESYLYGFLEHGESEAVEALLERRFPDAPLLISPPPSLRSVNQEFEFKWKRMKEADGYRLVIAEDDEFRKSIVSQRTKATKLFLKVPMRKKLWWRVCALKGRKSGEWSEVRSLESLPSLARHRE